MNADKKTGVVIVAGGNGSRMGADCPKQFLKINEREILLYTLDVFNEMNCFCEIVIVCHNDYIKWCRELVDSAFRDNRIKIVPGGKTRQESVFCGLKAMQYSRYVLIHDAVRCCVDSKDILSLCDFVVKSGSCALGVRVKDTVKIADSNGCILDTPDRSNLWQIQTPQAFCYDIICKAHQKAVDECVEVTDDCALVEKYGGKVCIVEGSYENIKITTPSDMDIAGLFLKKRLLK